MYGIKIDFWKEYFSTIQFHEGFELKEKLRQESEWIKGYQDWKLKSKQNETHNN